MSDATGMSRRYGALEALWRSFFDPDCYVSVARDWRSVALGYLAIQVTVFSFLVAFGIYMKITNALSSESVHKMIEQIPVMTINNGTMSTESAERVDIYSSTAGSAPDDRSGRLFMVVDPNNTIASIESTGALVLVQSKKLQFKLRGRRAQTLPLAKIFHDQKLSGSKLLQQVRDLVNITAVPVAIFLYLSSFVFVWGKAAFLALIMKLLQTKHSFAAATRLIIVASTPSMIISGISVIGSFYLGKYEGTIFTGLFLIYVWLAFYFCRRAGVVGD